MIGSTLGKSVDASVVDLFCGAGGLSHGFRLEGITVAAGIDIDEDCRYAYETNNGAQFIRKDVSELEPDELNGIFHPTRYRILVGCAPCQPFSQYNQKNDDPKWRLLDDFGVLIDGARPDVVSMENVPQLLKFRGGKLFDDFVSVLKWAGYDVAFSTLYGPDYGLAQTRSRLVLIASRLGRIGLPEPTHGNHRYSSVADAIGSLPALEAGGADPRDPLHRCSRLSAINLERMKASRPGGTWHEWPSELVSGCHSQETGKGYAAVYGRMTWDEPSPTITTQFYGFGSGRFGHPQQNRALSLREGAILQGFPKEYEFVEPGRPVQFKKLGRMIGNAVPVVLARAIARTIAEHLSAHAREAASHPRAGASERDHVYNAG